MKSILVVAAVFYISIVSLNPTIALAHGNGRESHDHMALPDLPRIPVKVRNDSDVFVVIYVNNLCSPRIALGPGESKIIADCFKQGLRYQGVAIFYTNDTILERFYVFLAVRPNEPWIFCKLPPGAEYCEDENKK